MRRLFPLVVLSALAAPLAARADGSIVLNARAGVAKPFGEAEKGEKVGDAIAWAFPLQADPPVPLREAALRRGVRALRGDELDSTVSNACSASGVSCSFTTSPSASSPSTASARSSRADPWIGAFGGYERLEGTRSQLGVKATTTSSGLEARRPGGRRLRARRPHPRAVAVPERRPVQDSKVEASGVSTSGSIDEKALHGWFQGGVRASLLF